MEELTIEQKAQRYDEILARAKGADMPYYKEDIMSKVKEFVDYLLPELKENQESEDERIRKNCIHFLELQKQHHAATFEIEECISWLEKQGEQTYVKWSYDEGKQIQINPSEYINDMGGNGCYVKNTAQASAWSEEDEKQARQIERIVHDDGCTQKLQKQIADWFKSLKARVEARKYRRFN